MRIAVSAMGADLSAQVDPRFGRCQYIIIVDPDTMEFEAMENSNIAAGGGAGIATAQTVVNKDVQAVLTGNSGPNAYQVLSAAGIPVITGVSGTVREAVEGYKTGRYQAASQPNVQAHAGMGGGGGFGTGMGMGGGMGRGMGRGMGMGMGMRGGGMEGGVPAPSQYASPDQEMRDLKAQAEMLARQLEDIKRRIDDLDSRTR